MRVKSAQTMLSLLLGPTWCVGFGAVAMADQLVQPNGMTGVLDIPSAFHKEDAEASVGLSFERNLRTVALGFQALPRLQTSLSLSRYADPASGISQQVTSLNFKYRLLDETDFLPAVSIGATDLFSNTRESAEYVVAGKSLGNDLRVSLGVGWGRLGGYDTAAEVFSDRPQSANPGRIETSHLFNGDAAFFGGVEWETPINRLTLAAEYSSAISVDPTEAPGDRMNFAAKYRASKDLDIIVYNRSGDTTGITLNFHTNAKSPPNMPNTGNVPPRAERRPIVARNMVAWSEDKKTVDALRIATQRALADESIKLVRYDGQGRSIRVGVSAVTNTSVAMLIGRTVRVLSRMAPPSVTQFEVTTYASGLPGSTFKVPRDEIVALADAPGRGQASRDLVEIKSASRDDTDWDWRAEPPLGFSWTLRPAASLPLDADGAIDPELGLFADARYDVSPSFYLGGTLSYLIAGNREREPAPAVPTPRTDAGSYERGTIRLDRLYGAFDQKISDLLYAGVTFGLLERQYRGVSAEALWLPAASDWALGAELTYAQKRDYEDPFGALDLDAVTGFLSVYWDTGYKGVSARVDAGRYLAGDWGGTIALSRSFPNGWEASGYATLTENNRDESLKLGASISIPFATVAQLKTRRKTVLSVGGNYGDAGARVTVPDRLISRLSENRSRRIEDTWSEFWN